MIETSSKMNDSKVALNPTQIALLEKLSVAQEKTGLAPAAAKIVALLFVSDQSALSFDQIRETLGISKSATSTAINMLLTIKKLEYINKMGDRKRYFRMRMVQWKEDMKWGYEEFKNFSGLLKQVLAQRPGNTTEFNSNLKEVIDFIDFLAQEMPRLYEKWEQRKG